MATQWTAQGITSGAVLPAATLQSIGAAWVDYTPTLTQGVTVTKTILHARYCQIQKLVVVELFLACTSAGTPGAVVLVGLPLSSKNTGASMGAGFIYDASTNFMYNVLPNSNSATDVAFFYQTGTNFGASPAITLANTDQIRLKLTYEAA